MPRKLLKRIMPDHKTMREHPHLKRFGKYITEPKLWHLNKRSVSGGLALGIFIGFMPIFGQIFIAAVLAIILRVNLPVAAMGCWITNPITFAPIFFFSYKLGAWLLQVPVDDHSFNVSWQWLTNEFLLIWQPLLLGSLVSGVIAASIGLFVTRYIWRMIVIHNWTKRKEKKITEKDE